MSMYIPSFAIIHATEADRDQLVAADVLAGIYLYSNDCLSTLDDVAVVIPKVRKICGFSEPLWIIRSRYFANLHLRGEGFGPFVNTPGHLRCFVDFKAIASMNPEESAAILLGRLLEAEPELREQLLGK